MKKSLLLTTAAMCAFGMMAQTDYAPTNWKFANMSVGSAENIFIPEAASLQWGIQAPNVGNWYTGSNDGGVVLSNWIADDAPNSQTGFTDEWKATFDEFYKAASIVDAGSENILCFIGADAKTSYEGGTKAPSMPNATLFWISGNQVPLDANYRFSIEYRFITAGDYTGDNSMKLEFHNASMYGVSNDGNGHEFKIPIYKAVGDAGVWNKSYIDFKLVDTKDQDQPTLPIVVKMNVIPQFQTSVILFRSFKLEAITELEATSGKTVRSDFTETSGVSEVYTNDVIVTAANGNITIIDANAPVEVYNMAGAKVASVAAPATVETISLDMNGVFVVKVGDKVQKVIL